MTHSRISGNTVKDGSGTEHRILLDSNGAIVLGGGSADIGKVIVTDGTNDAVVLTAGADNVVNTTNQLMTGAFLYGYDRGAGTWDRLHTQLTAGVQHSLIVYPVSALGNPTNILTSGADNMANSWNQLVTSACNYGYDGSTWDRQRSKTSDGADIANTEIGFLTVINLNYVWDAGNTKWVPMTQP